MKRKEDFVLHTVGGRDFLVPRGAKVLDMNCLIVLNATGRRIWELLAEDYSIDDLAEELVAQYDVESHEARTDVQVFLDEIGRLGMLET